MKGTQGAIHFDITGDETDLKRALASSRSAILASGDAAEQQGVRIEQMFKRATTGAVAFFSVAKATDFVKSIATVHGEFQSIQIALSTILGSESEATKLFEQLKDTAAKTPFDLKGVASGAKQLLAYGESADTVNDTLIKLGNIAAGLSQPLGDLVYLYGTTMTQGRLYTIDLNQFSGRGIPMIRELAKEFGVAESEVRKLVEEGKVGFPEVQKVINRLTSETGMFYDLMVKQSLAITGKISNLKDAWSVALDEMGKSSEGFLYSGIEGATYLVEHYDKVLKILGTLIAAYGSYKAALIVINTLQKSKALVENIRLIAMCRKELGLATAAQQAFNISVKANPYVLAISALLTVISALAIFSKKTDDTTRIIGEQEQAIISEGKQVNDLVAKINNANTSEKERKETLEQLKSLQPSIVSGISDEASATKTLTDNLVAYNQEQIKRIVLAQKQDQLSVVSAKYNDAKVAAVNAELEAQKKLDSILSKAQRGDFNITTASGKVRKADERDAAGWTELLTKITSSDAPIRKKLEDVMTAISRTTLLDNDISKIRGTVIDAQRSVIDAELEFVSATNEVSDTANRLGVELNVAGNYATGSTTKFKSFAEQVEAAKNRVVTLKQELKDLLSGKGNISDFAQAIEDKRKEIGQAEDAYAYLRGLDPNRKSSDTSSSNDYQTKIADQGREIERLYRDLELSIEKTLVDSKKEGFVKVLAQNKLNHRMELESIERQKEDLLRKIQENERTIWEAENPDWKNKGLTFTPTTTELPKAAADQFDKLTRAANDKLIADNKRALDEILSGYLDFEHQRLEIIKQTNDDISELEKQRTSENSHQIDAAIAEAYKQQKNALSQVNLSELKEDINWESVFGNLDKLSYDALSKLRSNLKEYMQTAQDSLSPTDLKTLADAYDELNEKISALRPGKAIKNAFADYRTAIAELKKAREELESTEGTDKEAEAQQRVTNALNKRRAAQISVNEAIQGFAGKASEALEAATAITGALESFGVKIPESIKVALEGVGQIVDGLSSIDLTKPFSIVTGAFKMIGGLGKAITSLFSGDNRKEKQIQRLQSQVDALAKAYDRLNDAIEKSYSTDYADLIRQQDENLSRQKAAIEEQIRLEEYKKDSDNGKIDQWRKAIDDIDKELAQTNDRIVEAIIGKDVKSAIDEFASAYVDAWAAGEDKAASVKDVVRKMVKSAVTELVKSRLSPEVNQFMSFLANAMQDGILSDAEQLALDEWEGRLYDKAEDISDTFDKYLTEDKAREATSRSIATASQESVDEYNGRLTVIQSHTYTMNENVKMLVLLSDKMLEVMVAIRINTEYCRKLEKLDNIDKEIIRMKRRLDDIGDSGVKMR